mgnify:CR=1 FL=1
MDSVFYSWNDAFSGMEKIKFHKYCLVMVIVLTAIIGALPGLGARAAPVAPLNINKKIWVLVLVFGFSLSNRQKMKNGMNETILNIELFFNHFT